MVMARSFAMSFNRLADRRLDAVNPRTAGRHLPAGILRIWQVAAFAAFSLRVSTALGLFGIIDRSAGVHIKLQDFRSFLTQHAALSA